MRENDKMSKHIRNQISFNDDFETDSVQIDDVRSFPARFTDYFKWLLTSCPEDSKQILEPNSTFINSFDVEMTGMVGSPGSKRGQFYPLQSEDSFDSNLDLGPAELICPQDIRKDDIASLPDDDSDSPSNRDRTLSSIANRARRWT